MSGVSSVRKNRKALDFNDRPKPERSVSPIPSKKQSIAFFEEDEPSLPQANPHRVKHVVKSSKPVVQYDQEPEEYFENPQTRCPKNGTNRPFLEETPYHIKKCKKYEPFANTDEDIKEQKKGS